MSFKNFLLLFGILAVVFFGFHPGHAGGLPTVNATLPAFKMEPPSSGKETQYLGLTGSNPFTLDQIRSPFVLIEIIGVYCPRCFQQAPRFNKLYHRIQKIPEMTKKIKMMAIAVGANKTESAYYKKRLRIPYPIVKDTEFVIHKQLGEPRTPFTMIVTKEGKVLFTHLGVIKDMDKFQVRIRELIR